MAARETKQFNYEPAARHYDIDENYDEDEVMGDDGKSGDSDAKKEEIKKTSEAVEITDDAKHIAIN